MAVIGGGERDLTIKLLADVDNFKKNMDKASGQTDTFANKSGAALKKVGIAVAAAAAAAGAFAIKFGVDAVKAASDLQETLAKTGELFGENTAEVEKFAAAAATTLGQSKQQALDAAANFAIFGKAAGLAGSDLVSFSTDFTVLASDLASFNNTSPEEAINAIGSALRGEAEPLRKYGVLLDDASLRQAALELGITNTTTKALTPQQKVLAAQKLIFEQTSAAQGDFARTSDGLANGQRILAAQFENVKTTVGNALLPVVTRLFSLILNDVVPVFQRLSETFAKNVTPQLEKVWQLVEKNLLPILQVWWAFLFKDLIPTLGNALKPVLDIIITGIQFLIGKVKENAEGFNVFLGIVDRVWQFIKTYLIPLFQTALVTAINLVFRQIGIMIDNFAKLFEIIGKVARFLGFDLSFEIDKATKSTDGNAEANANAYRQFQEYSRTIQEEVIPSSTVLTGTTNTLTGATDNLTRSAKAATEALKQQYTAAQALDLIRSGFGSEVGVQSTGALAGGESFRSAAELIGQFGGFIEGFNLRPTDPFYGFGQGSSLGTFKKGAAPVVNINVTGTVVDPEGAARAISDVLVRGSARAGNLPITTALGIE
jgi:hypothetical protein